MQPASSKRVFWNEAIGWPKASRSLTYSTVMRTAACAVADADDRDAQPLLREVVDHLAEALALGAEQVRDRHARVVEEQLGGVLRVHADLLEVAAALEAPACRPRSTSMLMPLWRCVGSVLTAVTIRSALMPLVMNVFGAVDDVVVAVADRLRLDAGEVGAGARLGHRDRGDQRRRRRCPAASARCCSSLQYSRKYGRQTSLCSVSPTPKPPSESRKHSSPRTTLKRKSSTPAPPYSSGTCVAMNPLAPAAANTSRGTMPSRSHSSKCGATSLVSQRRTLSRKSSCSSSKIRRRVVVVSIAVMAEAYGADTGGCIGYRRAMAPPPRRGGVLLAAAVLLSLPAPALAAAVPDGRIVYSCPGAVCTVLADGTDVREVTKERTALFPAWAPDGGRIAYLREAATRAIVVVDADGTGRKVVAHMPDLGAPAWSPDGKWIYFNGTPSLSKGASNVLFRVASTGGTPKRVGLSPINSCGDGTTVSDLDISAAGQIIFSGLRSGYGVGTGTNDPYNPRIPHFQLYTVALGGAADRQQKELDFDTPEWSPDGKSYAYWFQNDIYNGNAGPKGACDQSSDYYKSTVNGIGVGTGRGPARAHQRPVGPALRVADVVAGRQGARLPEPGGDGPAGQRPRAAGRGRQRSLPRLGQERGLPAHRRRRAEAEPHRRRRRRDRCHERLGLPGLDRPLGRWAERPRGRDRPAEDQAPQPTGRARRPLRSARAGGARRQGAAHHRHRAPQGHRRGHPLGRGARGVALPRADARRRRAPEPPVAPDRAHPDGARAVEVGDGHRAAVRGHLLGDGPAPVEQRELIAVRPGHRRPADRPGRAVAAHGDPVRPRQRDGPEPVARDGQGLARGVALVDDGEDAPGGRGGIRGREAQCPGGLRRGPQDPGRAVPGLCERHALAGDLGQSPAQRALRAAAGHRGVDGDLG